MLSYEPARLSVPELLRGAEWPNFSVDFNRGETIITYIGYEKPRLPVWKHKQQAILADDEQQQWTPRRWNA